MNITVYFCSLYAYCFFEFLNIIVGKSYYCDVKLPVIYSLQLITCSMQHPTWKRWCSVTNVIWTTDDKCREIVELRWAC